MNLDIRVTVTFLDHPKTIKLQRRLGAEAVLSLIRLWFYTAQHRPDGVLTGMAAEDLEIAARWIGKPGDFAHALVEIGFLDEHDNGVYSVHGWAEHNPYAYHAPERKERARKAAEARYNRASSDDAKRMHIACSEHASSIPQAMLVSETCSAPSPAPSPSPSPAPSPVPELSSPNGEDVRSKAADQPAEPRNGKHHDATPPCPHEQIIELYHEILPMCPRVREWNKTRECLLRARWRENRKRQNLDWWREFFMYVAESRFLTGQAEPRNGQPPFITDLEWLVRPTNFTKVIEGKYENRRAA